MIKIAFYGKGGIGKSTTVSNVSAALAQAGLRVLQVGCDPKADSTRFLTGGQSGAFSVEDFFLQREEGPRTVMEWIRSREPFGPGDVVREGFAGVLCTEAGGPLPGQGCAGRAVITALEKLREIGVYEAFAPDVVLYDVLGDVVCGGFAMPMRRGYADEVYILTSGESMALFAAANIGKALEGFQNRGYARTGGIILNCRNVSGEEENAARLAACLHTDLVGILPRSPLVQEAEEKGKCVLEAFPDSTMARACRELAARIKG